MALPLLLTHRPHLVLLLGFIMTSFGILLVTIGGSWDITNHLLNKPETFFSPPHALLYVGVAIALIGVITAFFIWRVLSVTEKTLHKQSVLLSLVGLGLLVGAGPFDFIWHSNFGLDGLLSPPHLTLIFGMLLAAVGSLIGISKFIQKKNDSRFNCLAVLATLPVWSSASGLFHSASLPFSNTDFFNFNPDPTFAAFFATVAFPLLVSFCLLLSSSVAKYQFGILSITGFLFLLVNSLTAILPNSAIVSTIPFYFLNVIPIVSADLLLRFISNHKHALHIAGAVLGSSFLMIYFPLTTYTYNEILTKQIVWPSLVSQTYFQIVGDIFLVTCVPAIFMGIVGAILVKKTHAKISHV